MIFKQFFKKEYTRHINDILYSSISVLNHSIIVLIIIVKVNYMKTSEPGSSTALILQFLVLATGIAIIIANRYWNKGPAVTASGIFFINIFWVTMVLTYDFKIWSFLRNTVAGGIFLISVILINLIVVAVLAIRHTVFR